MPNVQINYQSIGSGGGIAPTDQRNRGFRRVRYANDGRTDCEAEGPSRCISPRVLGGVVPTYNIPGVTHGVSSSRPRRSPASFWATITKWNDPSLAKDNPGVKFPNEDIVVVHRSDGSGTTFVWTDYLSKVSPDWKSKVGANTSVNWPVGLGRKRQRRCCRHRKADSELNRLRGADLCGPEQDELRFR